MWRSRRLSCSCSRPSYSRGVRARLQQQLHQPLWSVRGRLSSQVGADALSRGIGRLDSVFWDASPWQDCSLCLDVEQQLHCENHRQGRLSAQGKACTGQYAAASRQSAHSAYNLLLMSEGRAGLASMPPANPPWQSTAGVPLASVTHQGQAITYIAVPTGPSQINPQMQHALMKHAMASGLPGLQEQHGHTLKFEGGSEPAGQAAAHAAGHAAGQLRVWAPGSHDRAVSRCGASCAQALYVPCLQVSTSLRALCSMCRPGDILSSLLGVLSVC